MNFLYISKYCVGTINLQLIDVLPVLFDRMGEIDKVMPQIGMRFRNLDEAWLFCITYGGHVEFYVRKRNKHVSKRMVK